MMKGILMLASVCLTLQQPAHGWDNTHMFGDVCWSNRSSVLWLRRGELPSAVVGLRYPMETAHNCSFAVASDSGALIVVVRLLDLRREPNGTCLDHVTLEEGPGGRPLIFEGPQCSPKRGDAMHALVRGVVHVSLSVTPPVEGVYRGLNIAFTAYFHGNLCDSEDMFRCSAGKDVCIPRRLTCNGINNCGDDSDEPRHLSSEPCSVDPESIWGPIVFCTILVVFTGIVIYVIVLDICMARVSFSTSTTTTDGDDSGSGDTALTPSPEVDSDQAVLLRNAEIAVHT
ncbi:low-density lipoprotein receptor-related protein 3-like [Rhipicephalus microplus]|uniref:low-density lipoprotein receptor-related protein 3-like n=1 Tax=Rhipicephalus microplus TaxID=6941 RepID=UPI003F6BECC0